jgi:hypothetical protein
MPILQPVDFQNIDKLDGRMDCNKNVHCPYGYELPRTCDAK